MAKITRDEILKLASLSRIEILEHEIEPLLKQLQDVLTYAEQVKDIVKEISDTNLSQNIIKNINVFDHDIVNRTDNGPILDQAPDCQNSFFVVPKILEH